MRLIAPLLTILPPEPKRLRGDVGNCITQLNGHSPCRTRPASPDPPAASSPRRHSSPFRLKRGLPIETWAPCAPQVCLGLISRPSPRIEKTKCTRTNRSAPGGADCNAEISDQADRQGACTFDWFENSNARLTTSIRQLAGAAAQMVLRRNGLEFY